MKILSKLGGSAFTGLMTCSLLTSCSHGSSPAGFTFLPGPVISGGVTYYPAKPGATYHNTPPDYTTNPPPAGAVTFVTIYSTNGLAINLIDGNPMLQTNGGVIRFTNIKPGESGSPITSRSSPAAGLY
jgi:hypothetical protein